MTNHHWHPAFCGATEWELKQNRDDLTFEPEYLLSKEPLRMDMLIIKKNPNKVVYNEIEILIKSEIDINERYPGIYYLTGKVLFPTQIIVTTKLDNKHSGLKILSRNAKESDVRQFIREAKLAKEAGDIQNVDAVLQVSVSANKKLYQKIRREENMCQALRDLMKDEIDEEVATNRAEERTETVIENIKSLMKNMKWSAEQSMKALGIKKKDQARYMTML